MSIARWISRLLGEPDPHGLDSLPVAPPQVTPWSAPFRTADGGTYLDPRQIPADLKQPATDAGQPPSLS